MPAQGLLSGDHRRLTQGVRATGGTSGETIKAVSEYLGHADPGFTLRTYTHLMEGSSERTKKAIDAVFGTHSEADEDVVEDEDEAVVEPNEEVADGLDVQDDEDDE